METDHRRGFVWSQTVVAVTARVLVDECVLLVLLDGEQKKRLVERIVVGVLPSSIPSFLSSVLREKHGGVPQSFLFLPNNIREYNTLLRVGVVVTLAVQRIFSTVAPKPALPIAEKAQVVVAISPSSQPAATATLSSYRYTESIYQHAACRSSPSRI